MDERTSSLAGAPGFHLVDVFARRRYAGNQLAVVDCTGDATPTDDEMQRIAAEFDFSETTFVEGRDDDGWSVRIFTPAEEIPFAGHPTLGTAAVIRDHLADGRPDEVTLHLGVGDVPVWVESGLDPASDRDAADGADRPTLWMRQHAPEFGRPFDRETAARAVSLSPDDVRDDRPVRAVSTGLPTIVVPLSGLDALERAEPDPAGYDALTGGHDAKNVLVYADEARDEAHDYAVRVFAPYYDVPEDPATGSSNGCLAAYLVREGEKPVDAVVEQGYEMGRPSLLGLRAWRAGESGGQTEDSEDPIAVEVGGRVVEVAAGRLR